jgi:hypothetical protein
MVLCQGIFSRIPLYALGGYQSMKGNLKVPSTQTQPPLAPTDTLCGVHCKEATSLHML